MDALELLNTFDRLIHLEDVIYQVRDNEGLGWDGPKVREWAEACKRLRELRGHHERDV